MIIIDSDNYAASGIETMFFPGGEPHVKIPRFKEPLLLHLKLRNWNDVGFAACLQDALYRQKCGFHSFIPYFPAARQDKTDGTAPLTAQMMANFLTYSRIFVFDVHSNVLRKYIELMSYMPSDLKLEISGNIAGIIAPDEGAVSRATNFRDTFCPKADLLECVKQRDQASGRITSYKVPEFKNKGHYIIVDDICDGGATFNLLAGAFYASPNSVGSTLELFVSHGIFSKGVAAIDPRITQITTTDSWCRLPNTERLTVIPLLPSLIKKLGG